MFYRIILFILTSIISFFFIIAGFRFIIPNPEGPIPIVAYYVAGVFIAWIISVLLHQRVIFYTAAIMLLATTFYITTLITQFT